MPDRGRECHPFRGGWSVQHVRQTLSEVDVCLGDVERGFSERAGADWVGVALLSAPSQGSSSRRPLCPRCPAWPAEGSPQAAALPGAAAARRGEGLRPRAVAPPLGGAVCPPSAGGTRRQRLVRCLRAAATTRTTRAHFRCYLHGRLLSSPGSVPIARRSSQPPAGRGSLREGGRRLRQPCPPRT